VASALAPLAHQGTSLCVAAERAVSRAMGGSCSMPLAAHARLESGWLRLQAAWGDPEQPGHLVRAEAGGDIADVDAAAALGEGVAARLRAGGAR